MALQAQAESVFVCPACGGGMEARTESLACTDCSETVRVVDGVPRFPIDIEEDTLTTCFDVLSPLYETPVWFPVMYRLVGGPFAPLDDRPLLGDLLEAKGSTLLDVACGTGRFTRYIAKEAATAIGVDISDGMLETAARFAGREALENVSFARMSVDNLYLQDDAFDCVACCWALHLFPDRRAAVSEINRVLDTDGRFAGVTLSEDYLLGLPGASRGLEETIGAHVFDREELRRLLREGGFEDVTLDRRGAAVFFSAQARPNGQFSSARDSHETVAGGPR